MAMSKMEEALAKRSAQAQTAEEPEETTAPEASGNDMEAEAQDVQTQIVNDTSTNPAEIRKDLNHLGALYITLLEHLDERLNKDEEYIAQLVKKIIEMEQKTVPAAPVTAGVTPTPATR